MADAVRSVVGLAHLVEIPMTGNPVELLVECPACHERLIDVPDPTRRQRKGRCRTCQREFALQDDPREEA